MLVASGSRILPVLVLDDRGADTSRSGSGSFDRSDRVPPRGVSSLLRTIASNVLEPGCRKS
jgi:hypothetical protein